MAPFSFPEIRSFWSAAELSIPAADQKDRSSGNENEMAPKSQLSACSFQDSLRQKNWALEQIRKFPDTIGYVWTAENDSNTLRVDAKIFASAKKDLRKKKNPDTCGHGLSSTLSQARRW